MRRVSPLKNRRDEHNGMNCVQKKNERKEKRNGTFVDTNTAVVTFMYKKFHKHFRVKPSRTTENNIQDHTLPIFFLNANILVNIHLLFGLFSLLLSHYCSSIRVCRLVKPGCASRRHCRGEVTATQLDRHVHRKTMSNMSLHRLFFKISLSGERLF